MTKPALDVRLQLLSGVTEKEWQNDSVIPMARAGGWEVHHTSDSRREVRRRDGTALLVGDAQAAGYPDLTLVHRDHGVIVAELKKQKRWKWKPGQRDWLDTIAAVAAAQRDWALTAAALLPDDALDALGPLPRVYAAFWRPLDAQMVEDVLVHHHLDRGVWWPANDPGA